MIGRTLGHYRVTSIIGRGGMGEVYEAQDTRLGRTVAVKVLPAALAGDPERKSRFEREARAVAALNHPNIVTLHSVEEADGVAFITMERVAGQPLSAHIPGDGIPVRRLLDLAIQAADAVAAAHAQGITHRDLKPDNVMVSDDGRVKVLDFGLAKLQEMVAAPLLSHMATRTQDTREGSIVGTVAYMSPEQAEGKAVDARSDVFSLGVILYEMATGRRPFQGDSHASTLAAILRDTPQSVSEVNRTVPRELSRVIRLCLAKDPGRRCQSAVDLRNQLEGIRREMDSGELGPLPAVAGDLRERRGLPAWAGPVLAAIGLVALGFSAWSWLGPRGTKRSGAGALRLTQLTDQQGTEINVSLAPDGKTFAYAAEVNEQSDIFVQRVGGGTAVNVTNSPENEGGPAFSPDGERIAFHVVGSDAGLFVMGATGESRRRITTAGFHPSWSPDGREIVYCDALVSVPDIRDRTSGLSIVDVATGKTRGLRRRDAVQPVWSPDGRTIAFWTVSDGQRDIATIAADGKDSAWVTHDAPLDWNPAWSPDGKALYFVSDRGGALNVWKVAMSRGRPSGEPEPVTTETMARPSFISVAARTGALAWSAVTGRSNVYRIGFDPVRHRLEGPLTAVTRGTGRFLAPAPSPDGQWVVFATFGQKEDILLCRRDGSGLRRLTDDDYRDRAPRWSPDGKRIAFYSNRGGKYDVWQINPDGSDLMQLTGGSIAMWPVWDPRGSRILASSSGDSRQAFLMDVTKAWGEQKPQMLEGLTTEDGWMRPLSWSPDGRYLAGLILSYSKLGPEVGIYDFETGKATKVSDSGHGVAWLPDAKHLLIVKRRGFEVLQPWTGKVETILLPETGEIVAYSLGLSRDGRSIYLTMADNEADIWMLRGE